MAARRGALTDLQARLSKSQAALQACGLFLVGQTQSTFDNQSRGTVSWLPRGVPNRIGILKDLQAGKTPPPRRWEPRKAGIDKGTLRASISFRIEGKGRVIVGSQLDYASDVQRGSQVSIDLDKSLVTTLSKWIKSLGRGDKGDKARAAFGPLLTSKRLDVKVPPRPFVFQTTEDTRGVREILKSALLGRR